MDYTGGFDTCLLQRTQRTEEELQATSKQDKRNATIVELSKTTNHTTLELEAWSNRDLIASCIGENSSDTLLYLVVEVCSVDRPIISI